MEKWKIMLIDPPGFNGLKIDRVLGSFGTMKSDQIWPAYDLQIFGGYCKKNGHDIIILDANNLNLTFGDIKNKIREYNPDWVIFLTCFPNFKLDANVARVAKEISSKIKTACMSLSMFSVQNPEKQMEDLPYLDYLPWGEPEFPLMELINGKSPSKINGLYYKDNKRKVKFTGGVTKQITNLDELGIPAHSAMPYKIYKCPMAIRLPMAIVNCSRGCINRCVHCQAGNFQRTLRYRSIKSVLQELEELKKLSIKEIKFYDCSLPTNQVFLRKLCKEMIKRNYNFTWHCNSRAEFINPEILKLMKSAGCHTIAIGCESSDNNILKNMGKRETSQQIEEAVKIVKQYGMRVLMYLTFGLEGETEETMNNTFNFAKRLMPDFVTFGVVVPAPGTPLYDKFKEMGYLKDKKLELQDPNCLPSFEYPHLSPEKLHGFTRTAYKRYYFNPKYILMKLQNLRSFTEFKIGLTNALSMIKRYYLEKIQ